MVGDEDDEIPIFARKIAVLFHLAKNRFSPFHENQYVTFCSFL
jgi:hypothetical protein